MPLAEFRRAAAAAGRRSARRRAPAARRALLTQRADRRAGRGALRAHRRLRRRLQQPPGAGGAARRGGRRGAEAIYCLGDLGAFGPHPEKVRPLLAAGPRCGPPLCRATTKSRWPAGRDDCNCGYTDPRDNHFARLSYRYTARPAARRRSRPGWGRCRAGGGCGWGAPARRGLELLLVHGSPRRVNEFLFCSTSRRRRSSMLLPRGARRRPPVHPHRPPLGRRLPSGRDVANVGVIGRPPTTAIGGFARPW